MSTLPTVLIADDHPIFREGLVRTIERDGSFAIVAEASDGDEAVRQIKILRPDLALVDVEMPKLSGIDVAKVVHAEALMTDLVILTMYKDPAYFNKAMDLGVRGFLLKDSVIGELTQCLKTVLEGGYYITPSISHLLLEREKRIDSLRHTIPAVQRLTPAERNVLNLLAENLTNKEIADRLFVSIRTVENHRMHICQKLNIHGHHKLLQFAMEHRHDL
jgi:DNA-binding NarL/FixJ family response regulator